MGNQAATSGSSISSRHQISSFLDQDKRATLGLLQKNPGRAYTRFDIQTALAIQENRAYAAMIALISDGSVQVHRGKYSAKMIKAQSQRGGCGNA